MRAMVFTGPGVVEMQDLPAVEAGDDEVVIDVASVGICGSELHGITKPGFRKPPLVMGHEFAGMTADGQRVVVNPVVSCGSCDMCARGRGHLCRERAIIGIHRPGAFAEQVSVPQRVLHTLPNSMSWVDGALVEPLANGLHAWNVAGAPKGARVGVIGAGTIGLTCLLAAREDAAEVVVADLAEDRLATARDLGADEVTTALDGEFDVIIDAVGAPATHAASIEHLLPGGVAVWIGLLSSDAAFDAQALVRSEKSVRGTFCYSNDEFAAAIDLAGRVDLDWATEFPLGDGVQIFTELMNGRTDVTKAVLTP